MFPYFSVSVLLLLAVSCAKLPIDPGFTPYSVNIPADSITFAIIGDYGNDDPAEGEVAAMVKSWNPDFIITTGDNNYPVGAAGTIVKHIGKYYCDFIYNPDAPEAQRCNGKATAEMQNRFFPSPGNHDNYSSPALQPYLDYFTLPGDERNYEFVWGPAHFYSINTGINGNLKCCDSQEAKWLQDALNKSTSPFNFVYFHHPPYTTGNHGSSESMRWPFADWKVDAVFNGHDHIYERITDNQTPDMPYIICGNSGKQSLYKCNAYSLDPSRFTVYCDDTHYGAMRVKLTATKAALEYFTTADLVNPADVYVINK
ncbi:MAG: metallophosphoesterase [Chitinophagales bacterium]|nr:metallophosphoesterase [Chitinophagales bacterium]